MIAEYNASNVLQRRYVHGPGTDNPIVWYEGTGSADKRYMIADERGSITGIVKQDGSLLAINAYDEYGIPAVTNVGRFGYTGQTWLPEIGMNYYKARIYPPTLGRFMHTDPIGYGGGMNLYAYVGGDPVTFSDPSGLLKTVCLPHVDGGVRCTDEADDEIVVIGQLTNPHPGRSQTSPFADPNRNFQPRSFGVRPLMKVDNRCQAKLTDTNLGISRLFEVDPLLTLAAAGVAYNKHKPGTLNKSVFGPDVFGPVDLYKMIERTIENGVAVQTSSAGSEFGRLRITIRAGRLVGRDIKSGPNAGLSPFLTVILQKTGRKTKNGLPEATIITAHPGC